MIIDHHVLFSWCDKKTTKQTVLPTRSQRSTITAAKLPTSTSVQIPIRNSNFYSESVLDPSKDLATQIQSTRR